MPRRRAAKKEASKRPAPTLPEGDEGKDMNRETRRHKVMTLMSDFKTEGSLQAFFFLYAKSQAYHMFVYIVIKLVY